MGLVSHFLSFFAAIIKSTVTIIFLGKFVKMARMRMVITRLILHDHWLTGLECR
jgi:hypothetical protein